VAEATPPVPAQLSCLYPHRRFKDPKIRVFVDFMAARCKAEIGAAVLSG
jgi:DNA-binding transcriptional LysR family regulator